MSQVDQTWTLNAGETRRIQTTTFLINGIDIDSQVPNAVLVYDIDGTCPTLTGPTIPLDQTFTIHLAPNDFQYDYFYLNKGSSFNVTYQQGKGATDISILKGEHALKELQFGREEDDSSVVLTRYTGAYQAVTIAYMAKRSDVYTILYDSASSSAGKATVTIHVELTSYNLANQQPYQGCQALTCSLAPVSGDECLLLQAQSEVTVHITADRKWWFIVAMTLVPLLIGALTLRRPSDEQAQESQPPPATNPEAAPMPSAPPEATQAEVVDYESIPIVAAEDVYPIAVPVDSKQ